MSWVVLPLESQGWENGSASKSLFCKDEDLSVGPQHPDAMVHAYNPVLESTGQGSLASQSDQSVRYPILRNEVEKGR